MSDTETSKERRRFSWRSLLLRLLVVGMGVVLLGFVVQMQFGSTGAVRRIVSELDKSDPDWRLDDIERTRATPDEVENSARVVVAATRLLPPTWGEIDGGLDKQLRKRGTPPPVLLDADQQALLEKGIEAAAPAVAEARRLAGMPNGRHRLTIATNPLNSRLNDQQNTRSVASLLQYDALLCAQKAQMQDAVLACRGILNAARSIDDEPFTISQLVRIACVSVACDTIERVLAQGEVSDDDLTGLQKALVEEDQHPTFLVAMRGDRAWIHDLFVKLEDGTINTRAFFQDLGLDPTREASLRVQLFGLAKADIRADHAQSLEDMNRLVEVARLPAHEQVVEDRKHRAAIKARTPAGMLPRALTPAASKVADACWRKHAKVRSLMALVAAERYRMKNKTWPDKLEQLTPGLLKSVPLDPFDGKPMRYRKLGDGVVVYSIGSNGVDDGGNIDRSLVPSPDEGYRLWDVKARRQPPGGKP
jgi:hypothetical protein